MFAYYYTYIVNNSFQYKKIMNCIFVILNFLGMHIILFSEIYESNG